ncbi:MAG: FHA domain-containing protein [Myxococcales bacterium]
MPTLIFRGTDGQEQRMELSSELSVGREAGNDVVLSEQGVSRKHCRFFVDDAGAVWVEDLGSANGVLVGGERIGEATQVAAGVEVGVGGCIVKLAAKRATSARIPAAGGRPAAKQPVALARPPAGGGGVPGKRATRMMAAGEAPVRARPIAKAPPPREQRPVLRGMAGPFQGQVFQLDKSKLTVGRVPPADIMLEDDSVSRRHAEIVKTGQKFSVRDLGSANGTFLNGDRVSEAPIEPGDVVRFGVVELSFAGPGTPRAAKSAGGGKKKTVFIIGGVAVLLVIAVVAIVSGGGGKKKGSQTTLIEPPPEDSAGKLMGKCQAYSDPESSEYNIEQCVKYCSKAHDADPTLGANKKLKTCKKDLDNEKLLKDAKRLIATGQEEEGLKVLVKVEKDAIAVFPRAKASFTEAVGILVKKKKSACKGDVNGGFFEMGYDQSCRRALELTCNRDEGPDEEAVRYFQNAARNLGKGKGEYKCPPEYAKFQKLTNDDAGTDPRIKAEAAIRAKYPNAKVAEVMVTYFNMGRPKQQSSALKNERSRASPKERDQYNDLIMWLDVIDGKVNTAAESIRLGRAKDAQAILKEAFEADAKLMPAGFESELVKEQKAELAKIYYDMAKDEFNKEHYDKCFANVYEGYKLNPKNTDLAGYMARMEREANRKLGDGATCDSVYFAMTITAPDSPTHKKALEKGRKQGCPDLEPAPAEAP